MHVHSHGVFPLPDSYSETDSDANAERLHWDRFRCKVTMKITLKTTLSVSILVSNWVQYPPALE